MTIKNAITVVGDIDECFLFAYRVPQDQLLPLLPRPLKLVSKAGFGFLNVVVSHLSHMRPLGLPKFVGATYWHIAYRLYVQCPLPGKQAAEGLYFLRSDADSPAMVWSGNCLTGFNFHLAKVDVQHASDVTTIDIGSKEAHAHAVVGGGSPVLPAGSLFANLEEGQSFLKYKPAGIFVGNDRIDVLRIDRDESKWISHLVSVQVAKFDYLNRFDATLELCYQVDPIHYRWNRAERFLPETVE